MADFNVNLSQPQMTSATPIAPVQTSVGIPPILGDAVNIFAKGLVDNRKEEALKREQMIVGDYAKRIASVNDGLSQGALKDSEASMRSRAITNEFLAQYPEFSKEILDLSKGFRSETQLGEALEEEQSQQDLRRSMIKDFTNAGGMIPQGASDKYVDAQLEAFQRSRIEQNKMEMQMKAASEQRAVAGEERSSVKFAQQQQAMQSLRDIGTYQFTAAQAFVEDVRERLQGGEDPASLQTQVNMYFGNIEGAMAQIATVAPESLGPYRTVFENMKQVGLDIASGKIDSESAKRQLEDFQSKITLMSIQSDPRLQALYVASRLTQGNMPINTVDANRAVADLMQLSQESGGLINLNIASPQGAEALNMLKNRAGAVRSGEIDDRDGVATQELTNINRNVLEMIGSLPPDKLTPDNMKAAADYIASSEFRDTHVRNGMIDPDIAQNAYNVLQITYEREVEKAVTQRLQEPWGTSGSERKIQDAVNVEFSGSGVRFVPKDVGYERPSSQFERGSLTRQLNSTTKAVNQLIHMGSHLEGHDNYQEYWERNKHVIMPSMFVDPLVLKPGQVEDGYRYIGGNPNSPDSWESVGE